MNTIIAWLMVNIGSIAVIVFNVWFARGLWVATQRPRIKYIEHSHVKDRGYLLTVDRQQLLPPWLLVSRETWLIPERGYGGINTAPVRESDGARAWDSLNSIESSLAQRLRGALEVAEAREAELAGLCKP